MSSRRTWIFMVIGIIGLAAMASLVWVATRIRVTVSSETSLVRPGTEIADMIRAGKTKEVINRLSRDPSLVNATFFPGMTPLQLAALEGKSEIAAELLRLGADVNATLVSDNAANGSTPLMLAIGSGDLKTVEVL